MKIKCFADGKWQEIVITVVADDSEILRGLGAPKRLTMTGPTGSHSVNLVDERTDEELGIKYGRALVHLVGFLQRNLVPVAEIARAITHVSHDTVDSWSPSYTFPHAEFRRGVLAGLRCGRRQRKLAKNYETSGWRAGEKLLPYFDRRLVAI